MAECPTMNGEGVRGHAVVCSVAECWTKLARGMPGVIIMCFRASGTYVALAREVSPNFYSLQTQTLRMNNQMNHLYGLLGSRKRGNLTVLVAPGRNLWKLAAMRKSKLTMKLLTMMINLILSKVSLNEKRLKRVESMCGSSMENSKRLSKVETVLNSHEDRVRLLEYKSIDLEARSRRNNILFYGFSESRNENCKSKIIEMVQEELEIDLNESDITRAHRLGRYDATKK